jgi:hypothetical protein
VQIPGKWKSALPFQSAVEIVGLEDFWEDEVTSSSRLACMVKLTKDMEGMVVYIPDGPPTDVF